MPGLLQASPTWPGDGGAINRARVLTGGGVLVCILNGGCQLRFTLSSGNSARTCDSPMSPPYAPYPFLP